MNYLLDIKQDLLLRPNGRTLASNQQSAISNQQSALDFPLFSFFSIIFYCVSFLYSGFCFISLLYLNPMEYVCAFILLLFQSIAADCLQTHLMTCFYFARSAYEVSFISFYHCRRCVGKYSLCRHHGACCSL
ncbi:TPA: hypothetical protein JBI56_08740 [Legionella pneumophila]|nr:hypothetical protein [Legionella pneumophila]